MSAAGRLWRRAPLWRLSIGGALTFGVLSALYPSPEIARLLTGLIPRGPGPTAGNSVAAPPLTATRRTLMPIAGRTLPLPWGDWHEVLAGRFEPGAENTEIILARLERGKLTGLIDVDATTGPSGRQLSLPQLCVEPTNYAGHQEPGGQACWLVARTPPSVQGTAHPTIMDGALDRIRGLGVEIPAATTRAAWFRISGGEFMQVILDLPSRPDRVEGWMARWTNLLDRGFDGTLRAAQVTPKLARDPAA